MRRRWRRIAAVRRASIAYQNSSVPVASPAPFVDARPCHNAGRHQEQVLVAESTQVAIIGAGPAGLTLAHVLHAPGIESVVIERRDRAYVERRLRAGVLEQGTVDLLRALGLGARMDREGLVHHGINLQFGGERRRIALSELTGGRV